MKILLHITNPRHCTFFAAKLVIPPGQSRMSLNHPIPVRNLEKPVNGRSNFMRLRSSNKIYACSLAMFAKKILMAAIAPQPLLNNKLH